jgi:hypothetical protein
VTDHDHESILRALAETNERLDLLMTDFTQLQADVATLGTVATEVTARVAALEASAVSEQATVDAISAAVQSANLALAAALPTPPVVVLASVYTFGGDASTVDGTQWILTTEETTDVPPKALYTFAGDLVLGDTLGNGLDGGLWVLYTGSVVPVAGA